MVKTSEQIDAIANMIDKEIRGLKSKLTGIGIDDSYIHIQNNGEVIVYCDQRMLDGGIARHTFSVVNGVAVNYNHEAVYGVMQ